MSVMRLVPALVLFGLLGGQVLFPSDRAYAWCMCDQACPQSSCKCSPYCAVTDPFENYTSNSNTFEIRSLRSSALFTTDIAGNKIRSGVTLLAIPQGFVKLQCQRLKEMLNWASDLHIKGPEYKITLQ